MLGMWTICLDMHIKNEKTFKKLTKKNRDAAAKKKLIEVEYIGKSNNYYEDIYNYTSLQQHPLTTRRWVWIVGGIYGCG